MILCHKCGLCYSFWKKVIGWVLGKGDLDPKDIIEVLRHLCLAAIFRNVDVLQLESTDIYPTAK